MLIFKFYGANNSKTGEGAIRQGNADYFDFFRAKQGVPLTSAAVANFATKNCI